MPPAVRPNEPATWGYTKKGKVVPLRDRTAVAERDDPLVSVTGEGWPAWFPVAPGDRIAAAPDKKKRKVSDFEGFDS